LGFAIVGLDVGTISSSKHPSFCSGQDKQHWTSVLNIIFISLLSSGSGQTDG